MRATELAINIYIYSVARVINYFDNCTLNRKMWLPVNIVLTRRAAPTAIIVTPFRILSKIALTSWCVLIKDC